MFTNYPNYTLALNMHTSFFFVCVLFGLGVVAYSHWIVSFLLHIPPCTPGFESLKIRCDKFINFFFLDKTKMFNRVQLVINLLTYSLLSIDFCIIFAMYCYIAKNRICFKVIMQVNITYLYTIYSIGEFEWIFISLWKVQHSRHQKTFLNILRITWKGRLRVSNEQS